MKDERKKLFLKFIEFFLFHVVFTLVIVEVVIRSKTVAAELATIGQAAVSNFDFVFLTFQVNLKLFWTRKVGIASITTRPRRFRDRAPNREVDDGN